MQEAERQSRRREYKGGHFVGSRGAGKGYLDGDYSKGGGRGFKGSFVAPVYSQDPRASYMKGSGRGIGKHVLPPGLGCEVDGRTSGWLHFDNSLASRSQMSPASIGFVGIEPTADRTTVDKEAANKALEPTSGAVKAMLSPSDALATVLAEGIGWSVGSDPSNSSYFHGDRKPLHGQSDKWNDGINNADPLARPHQQGMFNKWKSPLEVRFEDFSNHFNCQVGDGPPRKKTCIDSLETTESTKHEWRLPTVRLAVIATTIE